MEAVPGFSYLSTAHFISVWVPWNEYNFAWVVLLLFFFQRIWFLAGGSITDATVFWVWMGAVTLVASMVGWLFQILIRSPRLLSIHAGWESTVLLKFPIMTLVYAASSLFYIFLPIKGEGSPWGLIISTILHTAIIGVTALWLDDDLVIFQRYGMRALPFFAMWMGSALWMDAFFWLNYVDALGEHWVALIAAGAGLVFVAVLWAIAKREFPTYTFQYTAVQRQQRQMESGSLKPPLAAAAAAAQ